MPVSLLVSRDGMSLVSFVGQTGNDFLELLRRADVRLPSLLSSVLGSSYGGSMLLAGRAQRSMPVLYVLGDRLAAMPQGLQGLQPFGLSDKPLSIEGSISLPPRRSPAAHRSPLSRPPALNRAHRRRKATTMQRCPPGHSA